MHNEWQDLIPFYVAGTLEQHDMVALEHHLARCEDCFRALNEWREVATVVQREAKAWAEPLPPLSQSIRAQLSPSPRNSQNGYQKTQSLAELGEQTTIYVPSKSRRSSQTRKQLRPSLSLVAAIFVIVIFSGILIYGMTQSGNNDIKSASSGSNGSAGLTPSVTPLVLPTSLTVSPSATPSSTITPFIIDSGSQTTPPTNDVSALVFPDGCVVTTASGANVYQYADVNSPIVDLIDRGDTRRTVVTDGNGWYQVGDDQQIGIVGWVVIDDVSLEGVCNDLVTPSQTPFGTPSSREVCFVGVAIDGLVNIYRSPGFDFEVITTFQAGEFLRTDARTQDGWYQVVLENGSVLAWVYVEDIETSGACDNLPVIAPSTLQPSVTVQPDACLLYSRSGFGSHIYAGPGLSYNIINSFSDPLVVTGLSDNDWYRVERWVGDVRWIGWVAEENATITGTCDGLPSIPSTGYIPNPMPSMTPTMASPASPTSTPQVLPTSRN